MQTPRLRACSAGAAERRNLLNQERILRCPIFLVYGLNLRDESFFVDAARLNNSIEQGGKAFVPKIDPIKEGVIEIGN
jgi:hypothetical protein